MNTPISDFIQKYNDNQPIRLHMPGHKGRFDNLCSQDITEINGADSLFEANGIIDESEKNASKLFASGLTLYSAEGSSLCIRAMVCAVKLYSESLNKKPLILATRNCHQSFISALALCRVEVEWLYGETLLSSKLNGKILEEKLKGMEKLPTALYVTSPDYLGNMLPIMELKEVCKKYKILLLVDNAHGAYLSFLKENVHPLNLGADMCCDSAHKTLPVLTGGAYLHTSNDCKIWDKQQLKSIMKLFASTSPSYLILRSLDKANQFIFDNKEIFQECAEKVKTLKNRLIRAHFNVLNGEPLKITLLAKPLGYSGYEVCDILIEQGIYPEFCDNDFVVFMFSPFTNDEDFAKVETALLKLKQRQPILELPPKPSKPEIAMPIYEAIFSCRECVRVDSALGRVLADPCVGCPPAVSAIISGEVIDKASMDLMKYYGIEQCFVVKN